jgi:hypothetical protein
LYKNKNKRAAGSVCESSTTDRREFSSKKNTDRRDCIKTRAGGRDKSKP